MLQNLLLATWRVQMEPKGNHLRENNQHFQNLAFKQAICLYKMHYVGKSWSAIPYGTPVRCESAGEVPDT